MTIKYQYYLVRKNGIIRNEKAGDVIRGYWTYSAPFHPTDNSRVYVLNGFAIGNKQRNELLKSGKLERSTKKEAIKNLLRGLR